MVETLRAHLLRQAELRLALGAGRAGPDAFVFCQADGSPLSPDRLSQQWRRAVEARYPVSFHALRHTHASALIARGPEYHERQPAHRPPSATITLNIYGHLFKNTDSQAALAIEAALRGG